MMCMRKHIDRTDFLDGVFHAQQTQIAGLRSRIAANVNDTFRLGEENSVDHIIMHTGTWWIGNNNIRTSVLVYEILRKDIFHITGIKKRVLYMVQGGIHFCVLDSLRYVLDADNLLCLARDEICDRTCPGI